MAHLLLVVASTEAGVTVPWLGTLLPSITRVCVRERYTIGVAVSSPNKQLATTNCQQGR